MSFLVHNNVACADPTCNPNRTPGDWVVDEDRAPVEAEVAEWVELPENYYVQLAHARLDRAEEAIHRARYLSNEIMAEYSDAGHAYWFLLFGGGTLMDAGKIHRQHYSECTPKIFAAVKQDLVDRKIIRVLPGGAWRYLAEV